MDYETHFPEKIQLQIKKLDFNCRITFAYFFYKNQEEELTQKFKEFFVHSTFKNDGYCKEIIRFVFLLHLMEHLKQSLKSRFMLKRKS